MIIAIHQPNYFPWLGYFHKISMADLFVFLDDVQYSKGSYINRVQVLIDGDVKWLSVPVSHGFGDSIADVKFAKEKWTASHLSTLKNFYKDAEHFKSIWGDIQRLFENVPTNSLAAANCFLIEKIANHLELDAKFQLASNLDLVPALGNENHLHGDDRLIKICKSISSDTTYISGKGGPKYQDPEKFAAANINLEYSTYRNIPYRQTSTDFQPGLSVLDAAFNLGWKKTAQLLRAES